MLRRSAIVVLACCALALAGCTSDPTVGADTQSPAAATAPVASAPASPEDATDLPVDPVAAVEPTVEEPPGDIATNELPTVAVGRSVDISDGVTVTVTGMRDVQIDAHGPGEVAGPGEIVSVTVANGTTEAVNLSGFTVLLEYGGVPAIASFATQSDPFVGALGAGGQASANYAFLKPDPSGGAPVITVESNDSENVVVVVP